MKVSPALLASWLGILATGSWAQNNPRSSSMSCSALATIVADRGAVLLNTGPSRFDRYVSSSNLCFRPDSLSATSVQSSDKPRCFVGYACNNNGPNKGDK
jgi:hypothetical protein